MKLPECSDAFDELMSELYWQDMVHPTEAVATDELQHTDPHANSLSEVEQHFAELMAVVQDLEVSMTFNSQFRRHAYALADAYSMAAEEMQEFIHQQWLKDGLLTLTCGGNVDLPFTPQMVRLFDLLSEDEQDDFFTTQILQFQSNIDEALFSAE